jgi:hypothetical protein
MLTYYFAVHSKGAGVEDLGFMAMADEGEALAFGKAVIRDIMRGNARQYADWAMDITVGKRVVGSIPFDRSYLPH